MTSPNESNGRQIQKELEQVYMFSTNNYETGLKIQLKSKETHTHTEQIIVRVVIKSGELVRLVAAPVKG